MPLIPGFGGHSPQPPEAPPASTSAPAPAAATTSTAEEEPNPAFEGYEGEPVLTGGDGGHHVAALCSMLAAAGYDTPVSKGEAGPILTDDVYAAVEDFRATEDIDDELAQRGNVLIGPATWAALKRATA